MKRLGLVFAIAACGGGAKTGASPGAPKAPSECAIVAGHVGDMAFSSKNPPPVSRDDVVQILTERCEADQWSAEAKACFGKLTTEGTTRSCEETLTAEQRTKVDQQMSARFGSATKKPEEATMKKPADGATTRSPAPAEGADPCEGGE